MSNALDQAAVNHTSCKVKSVEPPQGKIVYFKKPDGALDIEVVNSPIGYTDKQLRGFGEMLTVLKEEGKLSDSGSIAIKKLEAM